MSTSAARPAWSTCPPRTSPCGGARAAGRFVTTPEVIGAAAPRRAAEGRRAGGGADRRHRRRQAHARPRPAVPSGRAARRDGRSRAAATTPSRSTRRPARPTAPASRWRRSPRSSAAGLALYDMVKAVDRGARLTDVRLLAKAGGRSGEWTAGMKAAVITCSNRSAAGERPDDSGELLARGCAAPGTTWCSQVDRPGRGRGDPGAVRDAARRRRVARAHHRRHRADADRRHARGGRADARARDPGHRRGAARGVARQGADLGALARRRRHDRRARWS